MMAQHVKHRMDLFKIVIEKGGKIQLPKTAYSLSWPVNYMRAVEFIEEYDVKGVGDDDASGWNAYVDKVRGAIGVKTYCEWIRDENNKMVGVIAFYNSDGKEIKMKHFSKWSELLKKVKAAGINGTQK